MNPRRNHSRLNKTLWTPTPSSARSCSPRWSPPYIAGAENSSVRAFNQTRQSCGDFVGGSDNRTDEAAQPQRVFKPPKLAEERPAPNPPPSHRFFAESTPRTLPGSRLHATRGQVPRRSREPRFQVLVVSGGPIDIALLVSVCSAFCHFCFPEIPFKCGTVRHFFARPR